MGINRKLQEMMAVEGAPQIEGLWFRHFRGEEDYPGMLACIQACKVVDHVERTDTLEDITRNYAHLTNSDPQSDMLMMQVGDEMIGYVRVWWMHIPAERTRVYSSVGFIKPQWRGKGIGRAVLGWCENRQRAIAAEHPKDAQFYFDRWKQDGEEDLARLLEHCGYQGIRYGLRMVRPSLEDIPLQGLVKQLPAGLQVRPAKPEHYRKIWEANVESFRDHWGFTEPEEADYQAWLEDRLTQPEIWKVAWDGDEVAGMVLGYIDARENEEYERLRGWTENIAVRRPWRKRGLATALIFMNLQELKRRGMKEAALGVDAENLTGALRVYENAGFQVVKRATTYRKPMN